MFSNSNQRTPEELASLLKTELQKLSYILYKIPEETKYTTFKIPKKTGGTRTISKPIPSIHILQKNFKDFLSTLYNAKSCSYGFEKGKGIKKNAKRHLKSKAVLNIDIKDFFGSINFGRVFGLMQKKPFNFDKKSAAIIAKLVTHDNKLPQGAPTSPMISNMIAKRLDSRLTKLASANKAVYTRYVDDITFSTTHPDFDKVFVERGFLDEVILGSELIKTIEKEGFQINSAKSRKLNNHVRKDVTGITINEFPNLRRNYINSTFGMIFSWKKHSYKNAHQTYVTKYLKDPKGKKICPNLYRLVIIGRISYIAHIRGWDDVVVHKLCRKYCDVDQKPPERIKTIGTFEMKYDVFIGHASEEKDTVATPLYTELINLGIKAFIDNVKIKWGDSLTQIINRALTESKYFLAIISINSINKSWPDSEMNSAIARLINGKQKVLPLFVGSKEEIEKCKEHYSLISDRLYKEYNGNPKEIAQEILKLLNPS